MRHWGGVSLFTADPQVPRVGGTLPLSAHKPLQGDGAVPLAPSATGGHKFPSLHWVQKHHPRMCLSGGGKRPINHSSCDRSWVGAMAMAAPPAPRAKGNKPGTGVLAVPPSDAIRLQCCSLYLYQTGGRVVLFNFSFFLFFFFSVQQEIAGIVTYLARWPRNQRPRNIADLASPKASVLHTACKHPGLRVDPCAWQGRAGSQQGPSRRANAL